MKNILITCIGCAPASAIARSLNKEYNIYGIDTQEICVGSFICHKFIKVTSKFNTKEYWNDIENIIREEKITGIFVTLSHEILDWSKQKERYMNLYNCEIYLNEYKLIEIANCKNNTYKFCIDNNINIPLKKEITERPIIIKPIDGCGSKGIQILKTKEDIVVPFNENNIIQEFINGDEYTVDVISNIKGSVISIIPKKRLLIKNGQAFKNITIKNDDVISFVKDICLKLNNKSSINVQVIQERDTNKIYLIEINPRFATTINLSIEAGVHIPKMLIEHDYNEYQIDYNLLMVRDYKEYFSVEENYNIFLTGGAGFIGSQIVKELLKHHNYNITVYDNLSTVNCGDNNIKKYIINKEITFINGDIMDKKKLINSMKGHNIVIHMAAQLEITAAYKDPLYDLNINLIGTINVIDGCIQNNIKRLINASSACIYGFTDGISSKETDNTNPNWEYGITKLAAEKYIQIASAAHDIKYTSLRFSIVYGENEWYGRVLTIFTKRALENKNPIIFGDGNQERDYINVYDVARFVLECIKNKNTYNKNYNVSTGKGIKIIELANKIIKHFPNLIIEYDNVKEGEISTLVPGRERLNQELKYLILNNSKALNDTSWKPLINFDDELEKYIEWAKKNMINWNNMKV